MRKIICLGGLILPLQTPSLYASEWVDTLAFEPSARWRYQDVSDPVFGDTSANTALLRLSITSEVNEALRLFVQGDHSIAIGSSDYSDGITLRQASLIPDPEVTEVNQLWVSYQTDFGGDFTLGRQVLVSDNERHLGGNSFWQNEQSFDALSFQFTTENAIQFSYSYVQRVNRIFGADATAELTVDDIRFETLTARPRIERGVHDHNSHLLDVQYAIYDTHKISGFFYSLDNQTFFGFSSHTLGVRAEGSIKPDDIKYSYRLEIATQTDAYDSPWDYQAQYVAATVGAQHKSHRLELNYENIGDDNRFGFVHSLGSNHQFQGWADVFAQYQKPEGMADTSIVYRGRYQKLRWRAKFHVFQSADHSVDAGKELDVEVAYRATRKWEVSAVYAHYMADDGFSTLPASQEDKTTWFVSVKYNL